MILSTKSTWLAITATAILLGALSVSAQTVKTKPAAPGRQLIRDDFLVRVPTGVLFGKFAKTDGPFLIEGSLIVPAGEVLEFGPGCEIYLSGEYSTITVFGQMVAKGTPEEPVRFRSANAKPNPWDWDRIYLRSRNRSIFEYCIIEHSNYGIFVENGSATLKNCIFRNNSLHGLVTRNAEVSLYNCTFNKGHVCAILCQSGSMVTAESLQVVNNITGIACEPNATIAIIGGSISKNTTGIAVKSGAAISIVATDISRNIIGLLAMEDVPKRMREMVYENSTDLKVVTEATLEKLLKAPASVKSIALPKVETSSVTAPGFKSGFSALQTPREPVASFIGNVTVGANVFMPTSAPHPKDDTVRLQTKYLGEQSTSITGKIQPDIQVFASGRSSDADVNLLMDFYGNEWLQTPLNMRKNMFNLSMNYSEHSIVLGDFFENSSETSISSRKITGVRYVGELFEMGRGTKRLQLRAVAGESQISKDSGSHELDLYNSVVDSAMSIRQQFTYVAGMTIRPTLLSTVNIKGVIAKDQTEPFLRTKISDPGVPRPVQAQTGCIDGRIALLDGKLSVDAELDMGIADTVSNSASVAWYNPEVPQALGKVFGVIPDAMHYAFAINADYLYEGYTLHGGMAQIGPTYFAAGNPYLEIDKRSATLSADKQYSEQLAATLKYEYTRRTLSNVFNLATNKSSPLDVNNIDLTGKYDLGAGLPSFDLSYTFNVEGSRNVGNADILRDSIDATNGNTLVISETVNAAYDYAKVKNLVSIEGKQTLENSIDYSLRYSLLREDDVSAYPDIADKDKGDGWQHQGQVRFAFKLAKVLQNRTTATVTSKQKVLNSFSGLSYKFGDQLKLDILPRKLSCTIKGDYSNKTDEQYDAALSARTITTTTTKAGEVEIKYVLTSKISLILNGRYENSYDESAASTENYTAIIGGLHGTYLF